LIQTNIEIYGCNTITGLKILDFNYSWIYFEFGFNFSVIDELGVIEGLYGRKSEKYSI